MSGTCLSRTLNCGRMENGRATQERQPRENENLAEDIGDLSPTSLKNLQILLTSIKKGNAHLELDESGRPVVQYQQNRKIFWDASNANIITAPRTDADVKIKVDACLELITYLKSAKLPSGVVLDKTKTLPQFGKYEEGRQFEKTRLVLGSGNTAGDIVVVKDKMTGSEHAQKTMMISVFRPEEVRAWVDLTDTGCVPALYLFKVENNKIVIHMEKLENAKTLRSVIDDEMYKLRTEDKKSLVKPFSLYVLDGALSAIHTMHEKGWTHRDLHGGNVMIQNKDENNIQVKVLDFGSVGRFESHKGLDFRSFRTDIGDIVRLFTALYVGVEFESERDLRQNWKDQLESMADYLNMPHDERRELFSLVDGALGIVCPADMWAYKDLVKQRLKEALEESEEQLLKKVVAILFSPQEFMPVHSDAISDQPDSGLLDSDVADSAQFSQDQPDFHHDRDTDAAHFSHDQHDLDLDSKARMVPNDILLKFRLSLSIQLQE